MIWWEWLALGAAAVLLALGIHYAEDLVRGLFAEAARKERQREPRPPLSERVCRVCKCTDRNCQGCVERTGSPCHWVDFDLCSACAPGAVQKLPDRTRPGN